MGEFNHWSSKTHTFPWSSLFLSLFNLLFIFSTYLHESIIFICFGRLLVSYTTLSTTYCYFFHLMACHKNKNHHTSSLLLDSIVFPFNTTFKMHGNRHHLSVFSFTTPPPWDPWHNLVLVFPSISHLHVYDGGVFPCCITLSTSVPRTSGHICSRYIQNQIHMRSTEKKTFLKLPNSDYSKHKTKILVNVHVFNRRYIFGRKITSKHFPV